MVTLLLTGCGTPKPASSSSYGAASIGPRKTLAEAGSLRSRADDAALARIFARHLVEKAGLGMAHNTSAKTILREELIRAVEKNAGVSPDSVHRTLRMLVDDDANLCAGTSCARILGFGKKDVNRLMDEAAHAVEISPTLAKPEQKERKTRILASFTSRLREAATQKIVSFLPLRKGLPAAFEGTCAVSTEVSFGLRSKANPFFLPSSWLRDKKTIDFRTKNPKSFQGNTGACHVFAFAEMLKGAPIPEVSHLKNLDVERTFVEIWARSLGRNLEEALIKEVETITGRGQRVREHVAEAKAQGQTAEQAYAPWNEHLPYAWRMGDQEGNAVVDFEHIFLYGAVLKDSGLPRITIQQVESLTDDLMNARLDLIRRMALQGEALDKTAVARAMVAPMRALFKVAEEATAAHRAVAREEISKLTYRATVFDRTRLSQSIEQFMSDFARTGPLYIHRESHATAVVAYDAKAKLFYIRDSSDPKKRAYTPVDYDEFFNYLTGYVAVYRRNLH